MAITEENENDVSSRLNDALAGGDTFSRNFVMRIAVTSNPEPVITAVKHVTLYVIVESLS